MIFTQDLDSAPRWGHGALQRKKHGIRAQVPPIRGGGRSLRERKLAAASWRQMAQGEVVDFKIDPRRGPLLTHLTYLPYLVNISSNSGKISRIPAKKSRMSNVECGQKTPWTLSKVPSAPIWYSPVRKKRKKRKMKGNQIWEKITAHTLVPKIPSLPTG